MMRPTTTFHLRHSQVINLSPFFLINGKLTYSNLFSPERHYEIIDKVM